MKTKPLSETEQTVETFVTIDCGVRYGVVYTGAQKREGWECEGWECDGWRFTMKNQSFEYRTGLGHREDVTADTKKRAALDFPGLAEKSKTEQTLYGRRYLQRVQELRKPQMPPIAGVLYSLILDGSACNESFASWCDNFGYDVDSRKALATYEACQQGFDRLRKVFGPAQIAHIQELLQEY